ncbi:prion-inhibition and propagation-domain-containing protein [Xylaria sp. FL0933]|nr:prion-inhibition and propagation-domain-containing protein [Xylaria sp. FL0933]
MEAVPSCDMIPGNFNDLSEKTSSTSCLVRAESSLVSVFGPVIPDVDASFWKSLKHLRQQKAWSDGDSKRNYLINCGGRLQPVRGCVIAIELFSTARYMGADADLFHTGLEFEKYRLIARADRVGILGDNEKQTINWQLAGILLRQLELLLTSANVLRDRYSLNVTEEEVQAINELQAMEAPKSGVSKLIARVKPTLYTAIRKIISENNSTTQKFQWAARDRDKLKELLKQISGFVNKLEFLLDSTERQQEKENYTRLLREVISLTSTTGEAGQIKDLFEGGPSPRNTINAAAYLKQVRLVLGVDTRGDEITPKLVGSAIGFKLHKLSILGRSLRSWKDGELHAHNLEFATYHNRQVLVQREICLAVFLMSLSHQSFRSLPCLGYYPLEVQGRHGITYTLADDEVDWDFKSLKYLISTQSLVSLKRRLELMRAIADTVLQLHTAGWLHKSVRPENIIFTAPRGSDYEKFLNSDPYIIGYEYARSDTKDSANVFTELPDTDLETDLYRHPQARGLNRETFQKRFDMYAMACIFVELVMWKPLLEVFSLYNTAGLEGIISIAQSTNEVIELPSLQELFQKDDAFKAIVYQSGETIFEVIRTCFSAEKAKQGDEGLLEDQTSVVNRLEWCRI